MGPGLCLSVRELWLNFADMTLADDDINSILADNVNSMPIGQFQQKVDKEMHNEGEEVTKWQGAGVVWSVKSSDHVVGPLRR